VEAEISPYDTMLGFILSKEIQGKVKMTPRYGSDVKPRLLESAKDFMTL
jgi:hypothetical protein